MYRPTEQERRERAAKKKLYVCLECKHENREPWMVRTRSAAPKCPSCGSLSYGPKTKEAIEDIASLKDVRAKFKGPKGTGGSGFVVGQ